MLKTFLGLVVCCPISDHVILLRILALKVSNSRVYMSE